MTKDDILDGVPQSGPRMPAVGAPLERVVMQRPGGAQRKDEMSIHVCKCEHNGRTEFHLRYPGMTQDEAQTLADRINGGELVDADHPLRKDAKRYRKLRDEDGAFEAFTAAYYNAKVPSDIDAALDAAMATGGGAVGAA